MIWDLIQLWDIIWQEAHRMEEQDTESRPVPEADTEPREEREPNCFETHPYAMHCSEGQPTAEDAVGEWMMFNDLDPGNLMDCSPFGEPFGEGVINACDGAPGTSFHCNVRGLDYPISVFACLCCEEDGRTTSYTFRGAHESVNQSRR